MLDGTVNDAVEAEGPRSQPDHPHLQRLGKGSIFIWASGNGGRYTDSCNCDGYTNSIFTLSISSATSGWATVVPGGVLVDARHDVQLGNVGHDKSVATVDSDGQSLRPDRISVRLSIPERLRQLRWRPEISALALEANLSLTWRDMQYLVVLTSRPEPLEKESGWILNGVKRKVSHKFGYGLMDAGSMCKITLRFFPRGNLRILPDFHGNHYVHFWGEKLEGRWTLQILNGGHRRVSQPGILSMWQLNFNGTDQNPIRLKSDGQRSSGAYSNLNPFVIPTETDINQPLAERRQLLPATQDLSIDKSVTTLNGHNIPTAQRENVMADSNNKLVVLHDCDPECDQQGCYGKGPTQCVACKHYRLDNTCVSRCPPRSFPNQGGVCWPCHESCETCAGAGQGQLSDLCPGAPVRD
ncbi:hypothetical protein pipiens_006339 [Culex pipiens pipiens]|uniref:Uncharacterized protein n=1 Tax=Culex pipiens pipiens TaxID=38569 RepID=A0ABD1DSI1_CULPP